MFGWFRRNIRKVEVLGIGVEFHPPTDAVTGPPVPATPVQPSNTAASVAVVPQQRRQKVDWQQLLAILQQRVAAGQVTTYG